MTEALLCLSGQKILSKFFGWYVLRELTSHSFWTLGLLYCLQKKGRFAEFFDLQLRAMQKSLHLTFQSFVFKSVVLFIIAYYETYLQNRLF